MNRSAIVTAASVLVMGLAFAAHETGVARAKLPDVGVTEFQSMIVEKSARQATQSVGVQDDMSIEWLIDCYDQFGPEGAQPNPRDLESCIPS